MSNFKPRIIFKVEFTDNTSDTILALNDLKNMSMPEDKYVELIGEIQMLLQEKLKAFIKTDELLD